MRSTELTEEETTLARALVLDAIMGDSEPMFEVYDLDSPVMASLLEKLEIHIGH